MTVAKVASDCISTLQRDITQCREYEVTRIKDSTVVEIGDNRVIIEPTSVLLYVCASKLNAAPHRLICVTNERTYMTKAYGIRRKRHSGVFPNIVNVVSVIENKNAHKQLD